VYLKSANKTAQKNEMNVLNSKNKNRKKRNGKEMFEDR